MGYGCTIGVDSVVVPLSRIQISDRRGRCESGSADLHRTLLYAVQCPIQNCQILALMYTAFFDDSVRIRIGPTLLDPFPSAIPIGHVQAQDLSA